LASAFLFPALSQGQGVAPTVRIVNRIDESQLVTLRGNTHPFANSKHDQGKVADNLPMTDLILVLSRDPAQQAAFDAYVAGEYDQNSPNYHQWLTPDQVGEQFGPSQTDIQTITNWLTGHGFTVSQITKDRMSIRFNGTAAQVQSTFHTEIHNLVVKGQAHIGNMSDPQIPAALSPVVVGVKALHNFFPRPLHRTGQVVQRDASTKKWMRQAPTAANLASGAVKANPLLNSGTARPQFGISVGGTSPYLVEDIGPWDFATIYNVTPLWSASTPIDGTGQTIAIAGTSAICLGQTATACETTSNNYSNDVASFRTFFDLPTNNSWNTPIQISGNTSPLTVCTNTSTYCGLGDLEENSLDVEWSGAVAKNAQIVLVASYPASATDDGLYDSESYIVDNLTARIMNVSYGECELGLGTGGNVQYYNLWQTAAAEGIAVFVASGDSGSASCDDGGDAGGLPYAAQYGLSVSGLASTPWNTAVGGTDFNWCPLETAVTSECTASPYWSSTNSSTTQASALGYVPEVPWNDTCTSPLALPYLEAFFNGVQYEGSGNQVYSVTDSETGCNAIAYYATDLYRQGYTADLYLVDTVGGSGGPSNCVLNTTNPTGTTFGTCTTGQTSTGTSTNPDTNASQGPQTITTTDGWPSPSWQVGSGVPGTSGLTSRAIPDVSFFASDGFLSSSAYLICVSPASQDPECTYSTSSEPFALEVGGTSVATPAMAGVMALINQKAGADQGSPNSGLYALAAKQTYSNCSAEHASTGNGCYFNDIDTGTNAMACSYDYYSTTPSPNCTIAHSGDYLGILGGYGATTGYDEATGLGSLNIANVVNGWVNTPPGPNTPVITVTPNPTSINSSNTLSVMVTVAGGSSAPKDPNGQTVTPTGTVTLTANGWSNSVTGTLNSSGSATLTIPAYSLPGSPAGQVDTLTASYTGDVSYASGHNTGNVTVIAATQLTPTITPSPLSQSVNSEGSFTESVTVSGSGIIPTGTVTLTSGSYSSGAQTLVNGSYTFTIGAANVQSPLATGTDTLTITYSGDSNYKSGSNNAAQVTVTESTIKLTPGTPSSSSVTPGQSATVAVTINAVAGYTGIVSLTCQQSSTTASGGDGTSCTGGGSSSQVTLSSTTTSGQVTFTIGTTASFTAKLERPAIPGGKGPGGREWLGAGSGALLALLVFFGIPARRRSWRSMLSILVVMVALGAFASCGGGSSSGGGGGGYTDPGTTAGTYTYTVTATPNPSVSPSVTQTFTVTVN
jgi:subtilase family serine protease